MAETFDPLCGSVAIVVDHVGVVLAIDPPPVRREPDQDRPSLVSVAVVPIGFPILTQPQIAIRPVLEPVELSRFVA